MLTFLLLFIIGAALGCVINYAAAVLGWTPKRYSLRRKLMVCVSAAAGTVFLWYWEVAGQSLLPAGLQPEPFETLVLRFAVHIVFFSFLAVATLTDIDDMVISDVLTIAGTLFGLAVIMIFPQALLPATEQYYNEVQLPSAMPFIQVVVKPTAVPLNVCSPNEANLPQRGTGASVIVALWLFWCFAMLPRVWYFKLPVRKAAAIFCRYLKRSPLTPWLAVLAISGTAYLYWLMQTPFAGSPKHLALLSALTGCAAGMIIIWGVRIIGSAALGREAMGFGDVTLMGMIGVYVGWQSCILIFFLAPFAGLILGIANFILGKGKEFPYGPFLCLATVFLVVFWRTVWTAAAPVFELGWFVAAGMGVCLVMLGVMLGIWRLVKEKFLP